MRFDNIASAANTPGGFLAGVNDIIQAVMGAKREQAQMARQDAMMAQQQGNADRSYGQQQAQQLVANKYREQEIANATMNARTNQDQVKAQTEHHQRGDAISAGTAIGKNLFGKFAGQEGGMNEYQKFQVERQKADAASKADEGFRERARARAKFTKDNLVNDEVDEVVMEDTNIGGKRKVVGANGLPVMRKVVKARLPTDRDYAEVERFYQELKNPAPAQSTADANSQYRGEVMPPGTGTGQVTGNQSPGATMAKSLTPQNTGDTDGMSQNEQVVQAPALDYVAEDAKLQATNPQYRQLRANPQFNWKGAVEKAAAMRAQQPR